MDLKQRLETLQQEEQGMIKQYNDLINQSNEMKTRLIQKQGAIIELIALIENDKVKKPTMRVKK